MAKRRRRIEISLNAKTDMREIVSFISRGSRKYAVFERELIFSALDKLIDFPDLGKFMNSSRQMLGNIASEII